MAITPFIKYFIEESNKNRAQAELLDSDINKPCSEIQAMPINIAPRIFSPNRQFHYQEPQTLFIYPSKADSEEYLPKAEQLIDTVHGISSQAVFEIRGNREGIVCGFYAEKDDIAVIDSGIRNFYPKSITEIGETEPLSGELFVFDFLPNAPFYKALSPYGSFTISPLNIIPQILFNIEKNIGVYQILFTPLPGECHDLVKNAIDCEWQAMQGSDSRVKPSLQTGLIGKQLDYKASEFRSYFATCIRLLLPTQSLATKVRSFISNYSYGARSFKTLDNQY